MNGAGTRIMEDQGGVVATANDDALSFASHLTWIGQAHLHAQAKPATDSVPVSQVVTN
jgi:hypothetical protein